MMQRVIRTRARDVLTFDPLDLVGHELVEDVVGALQGLLGDDTGLLQQVGLDISTRQLAGRTEVDTDELTLLARGRQCQGGGEEGFTEAG